MKTCLWCKRVIDLASIEIAWIDEVNPEESVVEIYCSTDCVRKVIE